jgi:hypothetical protein
MNAFWQRGVITALILVGVAPPHPAHAFGDEGHQVIALIADHYLEPAVRTRVQALLDADTSGLTTDTGIASEATWADHYRDSDRNTTKIRYLQTHLWHFVDLELTSPSLTKACFQHPPLPAGTKASAGPSNNCLTDKIAQFRKELADPQTPVDEQCYALQFLLHFIGDLHQPLHASNDSDAGGNNKLVKADNIPSGSLHHYWDTEFIKRLGSNPDAVATTLINGITASQRHTWSTGTVNSWAAQSYEVAKAHAYGKLPAPEADGHYALSGAYVTDATTTERRQLRRAGVRLAKVLNDALH